MVRTAATATRDDAIELWTTWKGRYADIPRGLYLESNPGVFFGELRNAEICKLLNPDLIVYATEMLPNGAFRSPWPGLSCLIANSAEEGHFGELTAFDVFCLRARWCALFDSAEDYRAAIIELLRDNGANNTELNHQLQVWNETLENTGLPLFSENDLRGISLGGLDLSGRAYSGISLRKVNLSFSDLNVATLAGANLYEATIKGIDSFQLDLREAICSRADFSHSMLARAYFQRADLSFTDFRMVMSCSSQFRGANMQGTDLGGARLNSSDFSRLEVEVLEEKQQFETDLKDASWDSATRFEDIPLHREPSLCSSDLRKFIRGQNDPPVRDSWWGRMVAAIEAKPGVFGFALDLKRLWPRLK